jgi:hypothetical protein
MPTPTNPFAVQLNGWVGTPVPWSVIVSNPNIDDPTLPGTPIVIDGWVSMFTVKRFYSDPESAALYIKDVTWPTASMPVGQLSGELPDEITTNLAPGTYYFDVRVIMTSGGEPQMLLAGTINLGASCGTRIAPNFTWPA